MTRDDDPIAGTIETPVPFVVSGVPQKDIEGRPRSKLVRGGGGEVGVTSATKGAEVIIHRRGAKEGKVRRREAQGFGWKDVEEVGGSV
jgi:hypothetical protein